MITRIRRWLNAGGGLRVVPVRKRGYTMWEVWDGARLAGSYLSRSAAEAQCAWLFGLRYRQAATVTAGGTCGGTPNPNQPCVCGGCGP